MNALGDCSAVLWISIGKSTKEIFDPSLIQKNFVFHS